MQYIMRLLLLCSDTCHRWTAFQFSSHLFVYLDHLFTGLSCNADEAHRKFLSSFYLGVKIIFVSIDCQHAVVCLGEAQHYKLEGHRFDS
jgi:hypothetical protein